jgi:hypothetical protein
LASAPKLAETEEYIKSQSQENTVTADLERRFATLSGADANHIV